MLTLAERIAVITRHCELASERRARSFSETLIGFELVLLPVKDLH
jgi:hypothetical protein